MNHPIEFKIGKNAKPKVWKNTCSKVGEVVEFPNTVGAKCVHWSNGSHRLFCALFACFTFRRVRNVSILENHLPFADTNNIFSRAFD